MNAPEIEIRHGQFIDIDSPPQTFDGITFAAARVELQGTSFDFVCNLKDHMTQAGVSGEVKALVRPGGDAVWVRGRAQRLFLIPNTSADDRGEKTFFSASFIAVLEDDDGSRFGVPFACSDHYGRTSLMFSSEDSPPEPLQQRIAAAFWGLLLSDPENLDEYRDSMFHHGAGVMIDFGIEDGEPFMKEQS